jgi:hypothetical protein
LGNFDEKDDDRMNPAGESWGWNHDETMNNPYIEFKTVITNLFKLKFSIYFQHPI